MRERGQRKKATGKTTRVHLQISPGPTWNPTYFLSISEWADVTPGYVWRHPRDLSRLTIMSFAIGYLYNSHTLFPADLRMSLVIARLLLALWCIIPCTSSTAEHRDLARLVCASAILFHAVFSHEQREQEEKSLHFSFPFQPAMLNRIREDEDFYVSLQFCLDSNEYLSIEPHG